MKFHKIVVFAILIFGSLIGFSSCEKDDSRSNTERSVSLDKQSAKLAIGADLKLTPDFGEGVTPSRTYQWVSDNPEVAEVIANEDNSGTVKAKAVGNAEIRITSTDGRIYAICKVVVHGGPGVFRILAIGNSFSEDAVESYLYQLANSAGIEVVIGNLFIGGASLDMHSRNAANNSAVYDYRKIGQDGNKVSKPNTSISTAVADEDWDFISFQQASPNSGQFNTYEASLPSLFNVVKAGSTNPNVKFVLHQTWAYAQYSNHDGFPNYGRNQMTMYNAIVGAVDRAKNLVEIDRIVPAGTAIQNGRTSAIADNFTRDGYHLNELGKYIAASTWFEAIFGESVLGNLYKPNDLSPFEAELAQHAAHFAILKPSEVTEMVDYKSQGGSGNLTSPIFVGFGYDNPIEGWNGFLGLDNYQAGKSIPNLVDKAGKGTGVTLAITERFSGRNNGGEATTTTDMDVPSDVSRNSYYGNFRGVWEGREIKQSAFKLSGLNKDRMYNLCFFGSRAGVGDNRETAYIVKGATQTTAYLNTSNNKDKTACVNEMQPDAKGEITVTVTAGPNNNNGSGFYYLNAVRISMSEEK